MNIRLGSTVINCADLETMTAFWAQALSLTPSSLDPADRFRVLRGPRVNLSLQLSDTPVTARDQMHLDLYSDDRAGEVERLAGLGAAFERHHDDPEDDYVVMRDPEGNHFCVCAVAPMSPRYVAVVGPDDESLAGAVDRSFLMETAFDAGQQLAMRRWVVVCGGGRGVMGAVADGVAAGGGVSLGVLASADRAAAHPALTYALPTGLGELRNGLLVRVADAVLAIGGSWGTLSEVALAVRTNVPVVSIAGWDLPDSTGLVRTGSAAAAMVELTRILS